MGASIHISGTGSSIIDTVFVCRSTGTVPRRLISSDPTEVAGMIRRDLVDLARGGVKPTAGDIRCVGFGHVIRLAVWFLRASWNRTSPAADRLAAVQTWVDRHMQGGSAVMDALSDEFANAPRQQPLVLNEERADYGRQEEPVPF